jgi:lipid-A-disaccharide synthase
MVPKRVFLVAGEPSGDALGAELVSAMSRFCGGGFTREDAVQPLHAPLTPQFMGAGGPLMAAAGVRVKVDLTRQAVFGLTEVVRHYRQLSRVFRQLLAEVSEQLPDAIVLIDFGGFNMRFAEAVRRLARNRRGTFQNWDPKIIQYVSPQVWASRPGRAQRLAGALDLLLSIIPFEAEWYAQRAPGLKVQFVGHPMVDRAAKWLQQRGPALAEPSGSFEAAVGLKDRQRFVVLLPGSRPQELEQHLPIMLQALRLLQRSRPLRARVVLPNDALAEQSRRMGHRSQGLEIGVGGLAEALAGADLALASSGTVTLECACFGVPTVVIYRVSWLTYQVGRRIVNVPHIAMPNLLAGRTVYPEFIQNAATPASIAGAAQEWLTDHARRETLRASLREVVARLGPPGASERAARAVLRLMSV